MILPANIKEPLARQSCGRQHRASTHLNRGLIGLVDEVRCASEGGHEGICGKRGVKGGFFHHSVAVSDQGQIGVDAHHRKGRPFVREMLVQGSSRAKDEPRRDAIWDKHWLSASGALQAIGQVHLRGNR